jgi:hypothetical protein
MGTTIDKAPRIVSVGKRIVAGPTVLADNRPSVDIAALVEEERTRNGS